MLLGGISPAILAAPTQVDPLGTTEAWRYLAGSLLTLGTILVIALAVTRLLRRHGRWPAREGGRLRVIDSVAVGTRERAVLLAIDGQEVLIGVAPDSVSVLHVLGKSSVQTPPEPASTTPFAALLNKVAGR